MTDHVIDTQHSSSEPALDINAWFAAGDRLASDTADIAYRRSSGRRSTSSAAGNLLLSTVVVGALTVGWLMT